MNTSLHDNETTKNEVLYYPFLTPLSNESIFRALFVFDKINFISPWSTPYFGSAIIGKSRMDKVVQKPALKFLNEIENFIIGNQSSRDLLGVIEDLSIAQEYQNYFFQSVQADMADQRWMDLTKQFKAQYGSENCDWFVKKSYFGEDLLAYLLEKTSTSEIGGNTIHLPFEVGMSFMISEVLCATKDKMNIKLMTDRPIYQRFLALRVKRNIEQAFSDEEFEKYFNFKKQKLIEGALINKTVRLALPSQIFNRKFKHLKAVLDWRTQHANQLIKFHNGIRTLESNTELWKLEDDMQFENEVRNVVKQEILPVLEDIQKSKLGLHDFIKILKERSAQDVIEGIGAKNLLISLVSGFYAGLQAGWWAAPLVSIITFGASSIIDAAKERAQKSKSNQWLSYIVT